MIKVIFLSLFLCFVDFKPPQIFKQYFDNGTYLVSWSLLTDQELSFDYLEDSQQGWFLSGNCTKNGIVMVSVCIIIH